MQLSWAHEANPIWDDDKQRVIGSAPEGALDLSFTPGSTLPGDWWSARTAKGDVVGYGWLDATWGGDAEILLAVDASWQEKGVGSFIIGRLEDEAASRGLNYVYNTVREQHPQRDDLHDWPAVRGYRGGTRDTTLRKRVGADQSTAPTAPRPTPGAAAGDRMDGARPPGNEESGGYVNIEDHRY
jgi:GNAT superfamily N-acetyltransferase